MAWSWSHTQEAYEKARLNFFDLSASELRTIFAEWEASTHNDENGEWEFDSRKYEKALRKNYRIERKLGIKHLCEVYWERIQEFATCTNGGWEAYVCPSGCHTVSFDR
jgi:hypothetical protein